jgi:hypothetical protein
MPCEMKRPSDSFECMLPLHIVPKSNGPGAASIGCGGGLLVIVAVDPLDRGVLDEADDPLRDCLDLLLRHVQRLA